MRFSNHYLSLYLLSFLITACGYARASSDGGVKTTFQTSRGWSPSIDIRADAVMVYGVGGNPSDNKGGKISIEDRLKSWKERGYITHFMTGIAWGEYQDYFTGEWDGKWHLDEGQVERNGDTIWHGHMVPYIVPTKNYLEYFKEKHIKRVIDAGVEAIFLEEPEFWARAGYSKAFKKEWKEYYGTEWRPQHESPEATYMSGKLKYHLYYRALEETLSYAKEYGRSKGMDVKCYVPTHSLLNYSQWRIVSPEASLASLPCVDGYIAQVWTGTAREPNYFNGICKERVFETAYLEYGCMQSMTEPTGRKLWFLTDPIEDLPRDWEDYRRNYHATFAAKLLYPKVADYELMPWPERIYEGFYRKAPGSDERIRIPKDYSTMMQVMIGALHNMPLSENRIQGTQGISVLMANSLMFQGFPTHQGYEDPQLSNFYGLALPFIKNGIPVSISHLENLGFEKTLSEVKVLLMSYSNMKPLEPKSHFHLAEWVKKGGILVYSGKDKDPFQKVKEWWNSDGNSFAAPSDHLFGLMGIKSGAPEGLYSYGKGWVQIIRTEPKEYIMQADADINLISKVKILFKEKAQAGFLEIKNNFILERGPYIIAAVLDEACSDKPLTLNGYYIDLFDSELPVLHSVTINPGRQCLLYDIDKVERGIPRILASAGRSYEEKIEGNKYSFIFKGPHETVNKMRILLPKRPVSVKVKGKETMNESTWDEASHTCLLSFDNDPDGLSVTLSW